MTEPVIDFSVDLEWMKCQNCSTSCLKILTVFLNMHLGGAKGRSLRNCKMPSIQLYCLLFSLDCMEKII